MDIPRSHPRYESLMTREKLVAAFREGIVVEEGLIAHGRGEAYDYLLGEASRDFALLAARSGAAALLSAKHPVISVNGNAAALVPDALGLLSKATGAPLEVNLFHRTEKRVAAIEEHLRGSSCDHLLSGPPDAMIPGIDHARAKCHRDGMFSADVVVVPLEDGDRCEALVRMGKTVIAIDLNPLSRTARAATITIVDNVTRAVPNMASAAFEMKSMSHDYLGRLSGSHDNAKTLAAAERYMRESASE